MVIVQAHSLACGLRKNFLAPAKTVGQYGTARWTWPTRKPAWLRKPLRTSRLSLAWSNKDHRCVARFVRGPDPKDYSLGDHWAMGSLESVSAKHKCCDGGGASHMRPLELSALNPKPCRHAVLPLCRASFRLNVMSCIKWPRESRLLHVLMVRSRSLKFDVSMGATELCRGRGSA